MPPLNGNTPAHNTYRGTRSCPNFRTYFSTTASAQVRAQPVPKCSSRTDRSAADAYNSLASRAAVPGPNLP
eukprot:6060706-Alexandrium_andersonii.AAC.1